MSGEIGILNVGAGDTKLTFDPKNPQECIRAARVVKDMLRRGYALMVKVGDSYQRVQEFREGTCEYIIADFDPVAAQEADEQEHTNEQGHKAAGGKAPSGPKTAAPKGRPRTRAISASSTTGIAVGRTAGG